MALAVGDSSGADFRAGTVDAGACVAEVADAGVTLAPTVGAEFTGSSLPDGWMVTPWSAEGTAEVSGGRLAVSGVRAGTEALFGAGRSLEFLATFSGHPNQHVGFGTDYVAVPWIVFSTRQGGGLYARSNFYRPEETRVPGNWLGGAHRFRIDWNVLDLVFSVDGSVVATQMVPIVGFMRPLASDTNPGEGAVEVQWLRLTPYRPFGTFTSRVFDVGRPVRWADVAWRAAVPAGTSLVLSARTGDPAGPDDQWSPWVPLPRPGSRLDGVARGAQYRAELSRQAPGQTPVLRTVTLRYDDAA